MLVRTAFKASVAPLAARSGALGVARHNSTTAVPEAAQSEQPQAAESAAPARKSRIPLAEAYGDLTIPDRDSATQYARTRSSTVGTHRLSQDQFAGRGDLAARLLKKRVAQVSRDKPRRNDGQNNKSGDVKTSKPSRSNDGNKAENTATEAKEKPKRVRRGEPTVMEALPNKTNLNELFNAPSPISHQVVPLNISKAKSGDLAAERTQLALERTAGEYSRYLPPTLASHAGETMKRGGPVEYAQLALARVRLATPKQRQHALAIVSRLSGSGSAATKTVTAS